MQERRVNKPIKCTMMNTLMGTFWIGVVSLTLVQGLAFSMTSMEERFQNWDCIMIQNQAHQPHILKRRMTNDAKLAVLDQKLIVHNLRIMTLENVEHNEERMEESESEHLPQPTYLGNRGKHDLFDE